MTRSDELMHYGVKRRSGRYPWGSGKDPYQDAKGLIGHVQNLHRKGMSEADIAKGLGMSTTELRAKKALAKAEIKQADRALALRLKEKGLSNIAIGQRMGINESSVRALLAPSATAKADILESTADMLKSQLEKKQYLDIGEGTEIHMGISKTKLATSVAMLKEQGYKVYYIQEEQLGTGEKTTIKVLAPPDTPYSEVSKNRSQIRTVSDYSEDGGRTWLGIEPPASISSKRIQVRYGEDGGSEKDGVIELRRGVDDISLGSARYAQVRIAVDKTHYLKGMAVYADDLPDGVDIRFNTPKPKGKDKLSYFKELKDDPDNPFGATVRQRHFIDSDGNKRLSSINIVNEEGSWLEWSRTISSQVLSKQPASLAKRQLGFTLERKKNEYEEIMALTNPTIRQKLLASFADKCDSDSAHLKAAALPRQASHVILPIPDMKPDEVYAPNYRNGESVVLIRYPHGGIFEIPRLTVNNRHKAARKALGTNPKDAIGISHKVAERLSGADFDGDTVLVIPDPGNIVKNSAPLRGLRDFDPKIAYPSVPGMRRMKASEKGTEMGKVSNLITDMTIRGASWDEIAAAVRHSMVVIDAEKHNLNYKQSEIDNGIARLKKKYQGKDDPNDKSLGASTIVSRSKSEIRIPERRPRKASEGGHIDPETGKKVYVETGRTYKNKKGKEVASTTVITRMAGTDDARTLSSGTPIEEIYASHANALKSMANAARKEMLTSKPLPYSSSARVTYSTEVSQLKAKLNVALKNKPLERQAQLLANEVVRAKREANPGMSHDELKRLKSQALAEARTRVGAKKEVVEITPREWEAIQAGAVSGNFLKSILDNANIEQVKDLATPRDSREITPAKKSRAKAMISAGYTQAEVSEALGISTSTLNKLE